MAFEFPVAVKAKLMLTAIHCLPVDVARSSSDGNAICYALPVLWMTSRFSHSGANAPKSKTTRVFYRVRQVAAKGRNLPSPTATYLPTKRQNLLPTVLVIQLEQFVRRVFVWVRTITFKENDF